MNSVPLTNPNSVFDALCGFLRVVTEVGGWLVVSCHATIRRLGEFGQQVVQVKATINRSQLQSTSHSYIATIKKSQLQSSRSYNYLFIYFTQSINEEFYCSQPIGVSTGTRVPDYPLPYNYPGSRNANGSPSDIAWQRMNAVKCYITVLTSTEMLPTASQMDLTVSQNMIATD